VTDHTCDVAVIGAGTAGIAAERSARQNGAKTLLIDPYFAGTMCANVGCMPSKLLLVASHAAHSAKGAATFGIETGPVKVDGPAVMQRVRRMRDDFAKATREVFDNLPDGTCIQARARFEGSTELSLDNGDTVRATAIVIATGSAPVVPPPMQDLGDLALTNRSVFELRDLPRRLAVIGGGAIGLELAQAMGRLGVEVTLFDRERTLGGARDTEIQNAVRDVMARDMTLHLGVDTKAEVEGDEVQLSWSGDSEGAARFDRVLISTGRAPQLDGLNLQAAGLDLDDHGLPAFDRRTMQCGDAPIFLAGDVDADMPVLHEASNEGVAAGRNAVAFPAVRPISRLPAFQLMFTDPPLAILGEPPVEGGSTGTAYYTDQGRAKVEDRADGLVKIHARPPEGRLIGAELFAPGAEHFAHLFMMAIMRGETASAMLDVPFYHPTLEEGVKDALRQICQSTPLSIPASWDSGDPPGA